MKNIKKILSIMLIALLVVSAVPIQAEAAVKLNVTKKTLTVGNNTAIIIIGSKKISKENISDIYNFACDKLWNSGFCDMNWYCTERTNSIGQKMNPERKMEKIEKYMSDAKKWDKVVKSLKGKKYKKLKKEWGIIYSESKRMYKELQKLDFEEMENGPSIKYDLKVNKFQNHLYKLMDAAYSL